MSLHVIIVHAFTNNAKIIIIKNPAININEIEKTTNLFVII